MTTIILKTTAKIVSPIVLVVAISLFFEGHNQPGGGFIGGVLAVGAVGLLYVAFGLDYLEIGILGREVDEGTGIFEHRTVMAYRRVFVAGLVVAIGSGLGALVVGEPFLSQTFTYVEGVPIYGEIELATALLFDLGVFLVVVGGLLTIFTVVGAE